MAWLDKRRLDANSGLLSPVILAHAALLTTALCPEDRLWSRVIRNADYTMHFYTAHHMAERLRAAGRLWGYDPGWMAGYPESTLALVDNKLFGSLLLIVPKRFEPIVFNVAVLLIVLSVPFVLHRSARIAGGSDAEATGAALAGTLLTFTAPLTVLFWTGGAISFFLASLLVVPAALLLAVGLGENAVDWRRSAAAALLAAFALFVHPLSALPFAVALAPAFWKSARRPHAFVALLGVGSFLSLTLLPVVTGLAENRAQLRPILPHGPLFPGGLHAFVLDWWTDLLRTPSAGFFGAGGLAAIVILAALGLSSSRSSGRDRPMSVCAAAMVGTALLAYFIPSLSSRAGALQGHRFIISLGFFAAVPAGSGLARLTADIRGRRAQALVLVALLSVIVLEAAWSLRHNWILASGVDPVESELDRFLAEKPGDEGRVLVELDYVIRPAAPGSPRQVGMFRFTLLPLQYPREFIGTDHMETVIAERYATFREGRLFGYSLEKIDPRLLRTLLDRFAVSAIVACSSQARTAFDRMNEVVEPIRDLADCRGYRVREAATSRLLEGRGRVRAQLDRISVLDAEGDRLVLKYHWIPALATEPPLPIEEVRQPGAPVGFIGVHPMGVRDFDIVVRPTLGPRQLLRRLAERLAMSTPSGAVGMPRDQP